MICKRCEMQIYGHARHNKDYCRHCYKALISKAIPEHKSCLGNDQRIKG